MHVLLTNDDGPLNPQTCPYIKYLLDEINTSTKWDVSIVVPSKQRSWIGKAHFAGKTLSTSYIYTELAKSSTQLADNSFVGPFNDPQLQFEGTHNEWCLIDGTPASCTDIGIHHLNKNKGPVDLVLSGPNFGKNSSALYIMSSGTVGAAMEGSLTGVKSIGLSYSFDSVEIIATVLREAAKISVSLIQYLYDNWNDEVDVYTVNVPLVKSLQWGGTKIHYAPILQNKWGSIFTKIENKVDEDVEIVDDSLKSMVQFKWTPDFKFVHKESLKDFKHTDSRVLLNEGVSVTPLKATFKECPIEGEIDLLSNELNKASVDNGTALLSISGDSYIYPALAKAIKSHIPNVRIISNLNNFSEAIANGKVFHYGEYEELDIDNVSNKNYFINSYIIRKALIRKHYLSHTIHSYTCKHPDSFLIKAFPKTYMLDVDYAEFLDEALDDAYELRDEIEKGNKTWILKPSMSDKGQGIRLFQSIDQLQEIFDSFDEDEDEENDQEEENGVITSQLRHFVVQEYQENPLLLKSFQDRKFHIRCYIVCNGSLKVYVYKKMLVLFSEKPYSKPELSNDHINLEGHLTNTCLQSTTSETPNVAEFWKLEEISDLNKLKIFTQICSVTSDLFKSALNIDKINFQPLDNAFEIFGVDFLVDDAFNVSLLEVNSYPDFKQTGDGLKSLIFELFDSVISQCVCPFFDVQNGKDDRLIEVLDQDSNGW